MGARMGAAIASFALAACGDPSAGLLVVVASDYHRDEVTSVIVETFDERGQTIERRVADFDLERIDLPFSFLVQRRGQLDRPVRVQARAAIASGGFVERRAVAPLIAGETRRLVLFLARACENVSCTDAETTCDDGVCVDARVPAGALDQVEPGRELELDARVAPQDGEIHAPDGGVDAGPACRGTAAECDHPRRVAVGDGFACAVRYSERVFCWGANEHGQLGDGTTTPSPLPVEVRGVVGAWEVLAGQDFACARTEDSILCWGRNDLGQLGRGESLPSSPVAGRVRDVSAVSAVYGARASMCVQLAGPEARCWGAMLPGANGPLSDRCDADTPCARAPLEQPDLDPVHRLAADGHACGVAEGAVLCAGPNRFGELGIDSTEPRTTFTPVPELSEVHAVAVGDRSSCALAGATLHCWGANDVGQLGSPTSADECTSALGTTVRCARRPVALGSLGDVAEVVAGSTTGCARLATGTVRCWGADAEGALGDGPGAPERCEDAAGVDTPCSRVPRPVVGLPDALRLGAFGRTFCAVREAGTVACWGAGYGELPVEIRLPPP